MGEGHLPGQLEKKAVARVSADGHSRDRAIVAGYHLKNAYLLKHWDALQAGRAPPDDVLGQAEGRFFETLFVDPHDPSPLNGLGSVLMLERELDAAEFFILVAIEAAKRRGLNSYRAAEDDLRTRHRFKRE